METKEKSSDLVKIENAQIPVNRVRIFQEFSGEYVKDARGKKVFEMPVERIAVYYAEKKKALVLTGNENQAMLKDIDENDLKIFLKTLSAERFLQVTGMDLLVDDKRFPKLVEYIRAQEQLAEQKRKYLEHYPRSKEFEKHERIPKAQMATMTLDEKELFAISNAIITKNNELHRKSEYVKLKPQYEKQQERRLEEAKMLSQVNDIIVENEENKRRKLNSGLDKLFRLDNPSNKTGLSKRFGLGSKDKE